MEGSKRTQPATAIQYCSYNTSTVAVMRLKLPPFGSLFAIKELHSRGKIVVATRNILPGELVLEEKEPLFSIRSSRTQSKSTVYHPSTIQFLVSILPQNQ